MAKIISASINLSLIDKSKIVKGEKGSYYNLQIVVNDDKDQYGNDCAIRTNLSKEERESGSKPVYLGNGKTVWSSEPTAAPQQTPDPTESDELPW